MSVRTRLAMIFVSAALLVFSLAYAFTASGQRSRSGSDRDPARDDTPATSARTDGQWEYLVVSGGNVNFSTAGNDSRMRKQTDAFRNEAYPLERNLDKLGAAGWELVSVQGSPMEPVFYLKRPKESR